MKHTPACEGPARLPSLTPAVFYGYLQAASTSLRRQQPLPKGWGLAKGAERHRSAPAASVGGGREDKLFVVALGQEGGSWHPYHASCCTSRRWLSRWDRGWVLWARVLLLSLKCPSPILMRRGDRWRRLPSFLLLFFGRETFKQTNEETLRI